MVFLLAKSCGNSLMHDVISGPQGDSTEKSQVLLALCSSFMTPLFVTSGIIISGWRGYADIEDYTDNLTKTMLYGQLVQSIVFIYVAFVPYRNEKGGNHDKCMPKVHYGLTFFLLVVSPIFNIIIYMLFLGGDEESDIMNGYFTFNAILSVIMLLWFFFSLYDDLYRLQMNHVSFLESLEK